MARVLSSVMLRIRDPWLNFMAIDGCYMGCEPSGLRGDTMQEYGGIHRDIQMVSERFLRMIHFFTITFELKEVSKTEAVSRPCP